MCTECGRSENLEFDHFIPISKGGSSTARNIRLLCEGCNRRKGDRIGWLLSATSLAAVDVPGPLAAVNGHTPRFHGRGF
ncbi:MAG: HNH endonuclease [Isosphaeraceae bacterium]